MKGTVEGGCWRGPLTLEGETMEKVKKLAKNKWVWILALAGAALAGGGTYSDQITQAILVLLGGA